MLFMYVPHDITVNMLVRNIYFYQRRRWRIGVIKACQETDTKGINKRDTGEEVKTCRILSSCTDWRTFLRSNEVFKLTHFG